MEKCTECEFTETWNCVGEDAFRDNLLKVNKIVAKKDIAQKVINAIIPALHLVRSDIANNELLESLVANSEAKAHALHKNYLGAIAGLRESMADSKTEMDARIDVSEKNYRAFHGNVIQSLTTIANNQQEIVEMVHQLHVQLVTQATAYYQPPGQYARGGPPLLHYAPMDPAKTGAHRHTLGQPRGTPFVTQPGTSTVGNIGAQGRDNNNNTRETGLPPRTPLLEDPPPPPAGSAPTSGPPFSSIVQEQVPEPEQCQDQGTGEALSRNKSQHSPTAVEFAGTNPEGNPSHLISQEQILTMLSPASKPDRSGRGGEEEESKAKATKNTPMETIPMESITNTELKRMAPPTSITDEPTERGETPIAPVNLQPQVRGTPSMGSPFAQRNRYSFLDIEGDDAHPSSHNPEKPEEGLDPWDYPAAYVDLPWSNYHAQRRSRALFNSLTPSGKRKHLLHAKMEEKREGKSILIFGIQHAEVGADYEENEVRRAWPVFSEISKANMGDRGCDVKPAHIKGGHRLWKYMGDEKCEDKPIKIEFHTKEMALEVLAALKDAGMLGKRTLSKYGLYKPTGKKGQDKIERKRMPPTYVHPSTTKAQRDAVRDQNKYLKSDMYKNRVKSHHFTKHTRLDFSRFVLDPYGIPQPKLSNGEEEKLAMMDNPDYKRWYKYFTSNKIPEKVPTKAPLEQKNMEQKKLAALPNNKNNNNNKTGSCMSLPKDETNLKRNPANQTVKVKYDTNPEAIVNITNIKSISKARTKKGFRPKEIPPPTHHPTPDGGAATEGTNAEVRPPTDFVTGPKQGQTLGPEPEGLVSQIHPTVPALRVTEADSCEAAGNLPAAAADWAAAADLASPPPSGPETTTTTRTQHATR